MKPRTTRSANKSRTDRRRAIARPVLTGPVSGKSFVFLLVLALICAAPLTAEQAAAPTGPDTTKKTGDAEQRAAALAGLENQMRYAAASERKRAIRRVPDLKPEEQPPFLTLIDQFAREDLDYSIREVSLRTLGQAKHAASAETMIKALEDDRPEVVLAAIAGLDLLRSDAAKAPLTALLQKADFSENDPTVASAIRLLARLQHREVAEFLKQKAEDKATHGGLRLPIVLYFGQAGAREMNDYLMTIVKDEEAEIITRSYAVNSVGKLGEKKTVPDLRAELDKIRNLPNPRERARFSPLKLQLLTALVRLGDDSVEKELIAAARDDDARVRVRAIAQIGEARMASARPLLEYIVKHDASVGARRAATKALKQLDGTDDSDEAEDPAAEVEAATTEN